MYLPATNTEVLKSQINQHEIRIQKTFVLKNACRSNITQAHHQKRFGTKSSQRMGLVDQSEEGRL